jgi:hypothetical protein
MAREYRQKKPRQSKDRRGLIAFLRIRYSLLAIERGRGQIAEVILDRFAVARRHAVRQLLESTLLLTGRKSAPLGNQLFELTLVNDAGA